jgi:hypothetical protein
MARTIIGDCARLAVEARSVGATRILTGAATGDARDEHDREDESDHGDNGRTASSITAGLNLSETGLVAGTDGNAAQPRSSYHFDIREALHRRNACRSVSLDEGRLNQVCECETLF